MFYLGKLQSFYIFPSCIKYTFVKTHTNRKIIFDDLNKHQQNIRFFDFPGKTGIVNNIYFRTQSFYHAFNFISNHFSDIHKPSITLFLST